MAASVSELGGNSRVLWLFDNRRHARCPECRSGIPGCETAAATGGIERAARTCKRGGIPHPHAP